MPSLGITQPYCQISAPFQPQKNKTHTHYTITIHQTQLQQHKLHKILPGDRHAIQRHNNQAPKEDSCNKWGTKLSSKYNRVKSAECLYRTRERESYSAEMSLREAMEASRTTEDSSASDETRTCTASEDHAEFNNKKKWNW